jgi:hypothetical protein
VTKGFCNPALPASKSKNSRHCRVEDILPSGSAFCDLLKMAPIESQAESKEANGQFVNGHASISKADR